jgi:hypothetical protein
MVFDPNTAPTTHAQFMLWCVAQTEWAEGHDFNDPVVTTPPLRAWFMDIIQSFPPMNGPFSKAVLSEDEARTANYSLGKSIIYCCFAWSKEDLANRTVFELAQKHGVGFFNVSSSGEEVWLPLNGKLTLAHAK